MSLIVLTDPEEPLHGTHMAGMSRADMICFLVRLTRLALSQLPTEDLRPQVDASARHWVMYEEPAPQTRNERDARAVALLERWTNMHNDREPEIGGMH